MIRKHVKSSNILSIGYDEKERLLEIEFSNGGIYKYHEVPKEVYDRLLQAPSVGKFVWSNIRGRYRYSK